MDFKIFSRDIMLKSVSEYDIGCHAVHNDTIKENKNYPDANRLYQISGNFNGKLRE